MNTSHLIKINKTLLLSYLLVNNQNNNIDGNIMQLDSNI